MKLLIEIEMPDTDRGKIDAYALIQKLSREHKVVSSTYDNKKYAFTEAKNPSMFLKEDFDQVEEKPL